MAAGMEWNGIDRQTDRQREVGIEINRKVKVVNRMIIYFRGPATLNRFPDQTERSNSILTIESDASQNRPLITVIHVLINQLTTSELSNQNM